MISHEQFGELRLGHFLPSAELAALSDWEFMERTWVGEALGFSEWLRLEEDPNVLRSLSVDFSDFPEAAAAAVLETLGLSLRPGMNAAELRSALGEPAEARRFVEGRITYEFLLAGPPVYWVSCTVLDRGGLTYVVVMTPPTQSEA